MKIFPYNRSCELLHRVNHQSLWKLDTGFYSGSQKAKRIPSDTNDQSYNKLQILNDM